MKIKRRIVLGVLVPSLMETPEYGKKWLNLMEDLIPDFIPEFVDNNEPIKSPFASLSDVTDRWRFPLLWKRKTGLKVQGSILMGNRGFHTGLYMEITSKVKSINPILRFLEACSIEFCADFSYLHLIGQPEVERSPYTSWYSLDIGITLSDLRKGLPTIPWGIVFGQPYIVLIGEKRILNPPVGFSNKISDRHVFYQLSDEIDDMISMYPEIEKRRAIMREHIGPFFMGDDGLVVPPSLMMPIIK